MVTLSWRVGTECRCRGAHQLSRGADLSLVTVGFRWTLAKGFLGKEEQFQFGLVPWLSRAIRLLLGRPATRARWPTLETRVGSWVSSQDPLAPSTATHCHLPCSRQGSGVGRMVRTRSSLPNLRRMTPFLRKARCGLVSSHPQAESKECLCSRAEHMAQ